MKTVLSVCFVVFMFCFDTNGQVNFRGKFYQDSYPSFIQQLSNGDCIITQNDGNDLLLIRSNTFGYMLHQKRYNSLILNNVFGITDNGTGNIFLHTRGNAPPAAFYTTEIDLYGNAISRIEHKIYGNSTSYIGSIIKSDNGGYLLAGGYKLMGSLDYNFIVAKSNDSLALQWVKYIDLPGSQLVYSLYPTQDHGSVIIGNEANSGTPSYIIKIDSLDNIVFIKQYDFKITSFYEALSGQKVITAEHPGYLSSVIHLNIFWNIVNVKTLKTIQNNLGPFFTPPVNIFEDSSGNLLVFGSQKYYNAPPTIQNYLTPYIATLTPQLNFISIKYFTEVASETSFNNIQKTGADEYVFTAKLRDHYTNSPLILTRSVFYKVDLQQPTCLFFSNSSFPTDTVINYVNPIDLPLSITNASFSDSLIPPPVTFSTAYNHWYFCAPLGLQNEYLSSHVKIFPNPSKDILTIEFGENISGVLRYKVVNVSGQVVLKGDLSNEKQIDISSLSSSLYFIILSDQENHPTKSFKFVKVD